LNFSKSRASFARGVGVLRVKSKKNRAQGHLPCADRHADDGVAGHELYRVSKGRSQFNQRKPDRKVLQLCGQVRRALGYALAGCGDDVLRELLVETVEPAPDASRLRVTVMAATGGPVDPAVVMEHLAGASGILRREVSSAIVRKRTPELIFRVLAGGEVTP
jgi:ribosome-binding factor A